MSDDDSADEIEDDFKMKNSMVRHKHSMVKHKHTQKLVRDGKVTSVRTTKILMDTLKKL